jgi:LUC7 N_terminus
MDVDERAVEQLCMTQLEMEKVVADILEMNKELERVMKQETDEQQKLKKRKIEEEKEASNEEQESKVADTNFTETEPPKEDARAVNDNDNEYNTTSKKLLFKRQQLLFEISRLMQQYAPLQQAVESLRADLEFVRSDITTGKTVCEVSGNFMSARDADERIVAHYAGKQYVGWKSVRDKLKEMLLKYGRYGPPMGEHPHGSPRGSVGGDRYGGGGDHYGGGRGGDRYNCGRCSPSPP